MNPWAMTPASRHLISALRNARNARWFLGEGANPAEGSRQICDAFMFLGLALGVRNAGVSTWPSWTRVSRVIDGIRARGMARAEARP